MVATISEVTSYSGVIVPFLEAYVDDSGRHNLRAAFLAGLAHGLGKNALLIRHHSINSRPLPIDFREGVLEVRQEPDITQAVADLYNNATTLILQPSIPQLVTRTKESLPPASSRTRERRRPGGISHQARRFECDSSNCAR